MKKFQIIPLVFGMFLLTAVAGCSSANAASIASTTTSSLSSDSDNSTTSTSAVNQDLSSAKAVIEQDSTSSVAAAEIFNLNTASAADFLTIPSVGDRMVREFQEYRPYSSILQFRREIGKYISDEEVAAYEQYVYVPISVNDSDAATLLQISGLDEAGAAAVIANRPYVSDQASLDSLAQYISSDQLEIARSLLAQ
jgi:DNA uptake protein ComE-like DNA-binding protein